MQKEKALIPTARWRVFRNPGEVRELCQTLQRKLQPECVVESISRSQRAGIHLPHDGNEFCGNKNLSVLNLRKEGGALGFQQLKKMNSCPNKYDWGPTHRQNTFCNMSGRGKRHKVLVKCPMFNLSREEGSRFPSARAREFKSRINMWMSVKKPQRFILYMGNPAHHWSSQLGFPAAKTKRSRMEPRGGFRQPPQSSCPCSQGQTSHLLQFPLKWHPKRRSRDSHPERCDKATKKGRDGSEEQKFESPGKLWACYRRGWGFLCQPVAPPHSRITESGIYRAWKSPLSPTIPPSPARTSVPSTSKLIYFSK